MTVPPIASIVAGIPVNLPRPRTPKMLETPSFNALAQRVRAAIERAGA